MKKTLFFVCLFSTIVMSGCSKVDNGPVGSHNVTWYENHAPQMMKQLKWCGNDAARRTLDACKNADTAMNDNYARNAYSGSPLKSSKHDITPTQGLNGSAW